MGKLKSQGFTLIELIMVMVIVAVLATMTTSMITLPVNSYLDLESRTRLVDDAETALRRMQRDLRQALPNSIRITDGGKVIEMLHVLDAGRYRAKRDGTLAANAGLCASDPAGDVLDFSIDDNCFEVMGSFSSFNPQLTNRESLVVYNLGADAYAGSNRKNVINSGNAKLVKFDAFQFPLSSPQQRFFIVDTPVTYRCDIATNQLIRFSGYAITSAQPNPPTLAGYKQADKVTACKFAYTSSTATRAGLVSVEITLTDANGESARLIQQVHVDNAP